MYIPNPKNIQVAKVDVTSAAEEAKGSFPPMLGRILMKAL